MSMIRRAVDLPRNSTAGLQPMDHLDFERWWTDRSQDGEIYLHVCHGLDDTVHRVRPRSIRGYVCRRLEMRSGGRLFWLYDSSNASGEGRPHAAGKDEGHGQQT